MIRSYLEIKFLEFMPTKRFNEREKHSCMAVWLGGIFLKNEGGYEIVLRSLAHYKKRLRSIGESPELKEVAAGYECGISIDKFQDIKLGDIIEPFIMEEITS